MNDSPSGKYRNMMLPVVFNGCFGWLHPGRPENRYDIAVLLCAGVGQDFTNGYRPFRLLANYLSAAGYPTLRFDYLRTGDSADIDSKNLWQVWLDNIDFACSWLREHIKCTRLLVIGLRIGGTMAAITATRRNDIAGLVLIEPYLTGRSYVTQLVTEARIRGQVNSAGNIESGEFNQTIESLAQIRTVDLSKLIFTSPLQVAIFTRTEYDRIFLRLKDLTNYNSTLSCSPLKGLEMFLRPCHHIGESDFDPKPILDWINTEIIPHVTSDSLSFNYSLHSAVDLPFCREVPLWFGQGQHLIGKLCQPCNVNTPGLVILICNAGGNPHHGFARFGVELARSLAREGIASLRFDFAGIGDSICDINGIDAQTEIFTEDRTADISAAINELTALGFNRFALHGLCSGAYHALLGACADNRVNMLLAINLPWFSLRHEHPGPDSNTQICVDTLRSLRTISLFLYGEHDPGLRVLERHFGKGGSSLQRDENFQLSVLHDLDHELTASWMRREVTTQIIRFIDKNKRLLERPYLGGKSQHGNSKHHSRDDG